MITKTDQIKRVRLYLTALTFLGKDASPQDEANDELGCADSVSKVIQASFPDAIRGSVSTSDLYNQLKASKQFDRVLDFRAGDVIISPTGYGKTGKISNGHVGIVGENEEIMSNSSSTGLWTTNYTLASWVARFRKLGGYPIFVFRKNTL